MKRQHAKNSLTGIDESTDQPAPKRSTVTKFLIAGISLFVLSILMWYFTIRMFTARGEFHRFVISLAELCLFLWFPFFVIGIIMSLLSIVLIAVKYDNKKKK